MNVPVLLSITILTGSSTPHRSFYSTLRCFPYRREGEKQGITSEHFCSAVNENMKTITSEKTNFGRYGYTLTVEIGDEVNDGTTKLVLKEALPNLGFRAVGSEVEKALVAAKVMTKDTKRSDVPYSLETSKLIAEKAQAKLDAICTKEGYPAIVFAPTGEHVYGEGQANSRVVATNFWQGLQTKPDNVFAAGCLLYGVDPEWEKLPADEYEAKAIEAIHATMKAMNAKPAK